MYHLVYLTTNLINSKIYIGVHSTHHLDDGYLGSGIKLRMAINKYGKSNFKREIIYFCLDRVDANEWETKIVTSSFIRRKDTYNVTVGGVGIAKGTTHTSLNFNKVKRTRVPHSEEAKQNMSIAAKNRRYSKEARQKMSDNRKNMSEEHRKNLSKPKTKCISEESRKRYSDSFKLRFLNESEEQKLKRIEGVKQGWIKRRLNKTKDSIPV
jgi:hypothetical protein